MLVSVGDVTVIQPNGGVARQHAADDEPAHRFEKPAQACGDERACPQDNGFVKVHVVRQFDLDKGGDGGDAGGKQPVGYGEGFEQRFFAQQFVLGDGLGGHGLCGFGVKRRAA